MLFFPTVVLVASCAYLADALPGGAPASTCDNLTPIHSSIAAQTSEVPFVIDVTQFDDGSGTLVYTPGRTYTCKALHLYFFVAALRLYIDMTSSFMSVRI